MNCCSLCEKIYLSEEKFNIYLCYDCHNKTSFCMNCDKIMSKIFNNTNIFKCEHCNKVTPAIYKQLAERESVPESNLFGNISAINDNNENRILNNNLSVNSSISFTSLAPIRISIIFFPIIFGKTVEPT